MQDHSNKVTTVLRQNSKQFWSPVPCNAIVSEALMTETLSKPIFPATIYELFDIFVSLGLSTLHLMGSQQTCIRWKN